LSVRPTMGGSVLSGVLESRQTSNPGFDRNCYQPKLLQENRPV